MSDRTLEERVHRVLKDTQELYQSDTLPWVVGYSGGKDSTATLQLVWAAIAGLPEAQRTKPIHVISTDTLVENPIVAIWVSNSLKCMEVAAREQNIPVKPHRLTPQLPDRFWVNLIGRGYPAPRPLFRWCTSRLKISASNRFITQMADKHGEAILVLGSRKAESAARSRVLKEYENSTRRLLSRNADASLDRVWVYTPVSSWTNDDVWEYLVTYDNPWDYDNNELLRIYRGATPDAECPLVVDKSTPSCGDSRFGCFVCTMVSEDKSMQAMIQNDDEKRWMEPLLKFRNKYLDTANDRSVRDFRKMDGSLQLQFLNLRDAKSGTLPKKRKIVEQRIVQKLTSETVEGYPKPNRRVLVEEKYVVEGKSKDAAADEETMIGTCEVEKIAILVHGPYVASQRERMLTALLQAQTEIRKNLPPSMSDFSVIDMDELEEIRRLWAKEKRQLEDEIPTIYALANDGEKYPNPEIDEAMPLQPHAGRLLREVCRDTMIDAPHSGPLSPQDLHFQLLREALHVSFSYRTAVKRVGLQEDLDSVFRANSFDNEDQALDAAIADAVAGVEALRRYKRRSDTVKVDEDLAEDEV